ncbi:MAG: nucleotidyltransferase domain-containing protein [Candidatus Nomurabacteria bacterium]|jgi:type I restriction enzyme S subunit|nr:nucleotidyltransferase domain-containing protein [Candidatus Nomurabacteria bacterium]
MIQIKAEDLAVVKKLLNFEVPDKEVVAFGSRVYGVPREKSDLDIAVKGATTAEINQLKDYFSVAPLSIIIDVSNYEKLDDWLRKIVDEQGEKIQ